MKGGNPMIYHPTRPLTDTDPGPDRDLPLLRWLVWLSLGFAAGALIALVLLFAGSSDAAEAADPNVCPAADAGRFPASECWQHQHPWSSIGWHFYWYGDGLRLVTEPAGYDYRAVLIVGVDGQQTLQKFPNDSTTYFAPGRVEIARVVVWKFERYTSPTTTQPPASTTTLPTTSTTSPPPTSTTTPPTPSTTSPPPTPTQPPASTTTQPPASTTPPTPSTTSPPPTPSTTSPPPTTTPPSGTRPATPCTETNCLPATGLSTSLTMLGGVLLLVGIALVVSTRRPDPLKNGDPHR